MNIVIKTRFSSIHFLEEKVPFRDFFTCSKYENTLRRSNLAFFLQEEVFFSKYIDLNDTKDEIFMNFSATTRNEIRKAEKMGITCRFSVHPEIVRSLHEKMAEEKGMSDDGINDTYRTLFPFLHCSVAEYNGKILVGHSYLVTTHGGGIARLKTSASSFRTASPEIQKIVGSANRLLHFSDILYWKEKGFRKYDFGGYAKDIPAEDPRRNINRFKDSFGGVECIYYNYKTIPYLLIELVSRMIKCRRKKK